MNGKDQESVVFSEATFYLLFPKRGAFSSH